MPNRHITLYKRGATPLAGAGKIEVSAKVTYTPTGGEPNTESKKVS